jgi:hypothetical protein
VHNLSFTTHQRPPSDQQRTNKTLRTLAASKIAAIAVDPECLNLRSGMQEQDRASPKDTREWVDEFFVDWWIGVVCHETNTFASAVPYWATRQTAVNIKTRHIY